MRGLLLAPIGLVVLLLAGLAPTTASAASPHFINASANLQGTNLVVSWKEAGLGNDVVIHYVASANATAQYACINGGGNHPKATNKETVSGPVSAAGDFSSGKNGSISGSLSISAPGAGAFTCPGGQRLVLAQVRYTNISLQDTTDGIAAAIAGSSCGSFINLPDFAC